MHERSSVYCISGSISGLDNLVQFSCFKKKKKLHGSDCFISQFESIEICLGKKKIVLVSNAVYFDTDVSIIAQMLKTNYIAILAQRLDLLILIMFELNSHMGVQVHCGRECGKYTSLYIWGVYQQVYQ